MIKRTEEELTKRFGTVIFELFQIIYQDAVKMWKILNTQTKGANLCEVFTHQ